MTITKNASRLIASALACTLALGTAAMPALAATPANPEPAICAQSDIISNYDAFLTATIWVGWSERDVASGQTTLICDSSGNPDFYSVMIESKHTGDVCTVYVDAYTGRVLCVV